MPIFTNNEISIDSEFYPQLQEVIDRFIFTYKDEFAAERFFERYLEAKEKLKTVGETEGIPSDATLRSLGLHRVKIRGYKYMLVYSQRDNKISIHGIFSSGRDFSKIF